MQGAIGFELYFAILEAWNRHDAARFAALFAEDGSVVGFDGSEMVGRASIEATLQQIFADHQTGRYVGKIREERMLTSGVLLVRAVCGMVPPGGKDINPAVNAIQSLIALRSGQSWSAAFFQNTPAQFHGRPELAEALTRELQELA